MSYILYPQIKINKNQSKKVQILVRSLREEVCTVILATPVLKEEKNKLFWPHLLLLLLLVVKTVILATPGHHSKNNLKKKTNKQTNAKKKHILATPGQYSNFHCHNKQIITNLKQANKQILAN